MSRKFKVGDTVLCIREYDGNSFILNKKGVITCMSTYDYGVEFEVNVYGHKLNGDAPDGFGWYVAGSCLKLVNSLETELI